MTDDLDADDAAADSPRGDRPAGMVYLVRDRPAAARDNPVDADIPDDSDGDVVVSGTDGGAGRADGADLPDPKSGRTPAGEDWPWVVEWRAGGEPTPWATGLALTVFSALVVGVAVWVLSAGLVDRPIVAVLVNLLVAGGLAPAMWLSKDLPVLRWIAAGTLVGIVGGWIAALMMLPMPTV